jgi:hypothetical protein
MKTLLVVFGHSKANDTIRRNFPYWLNAGTDMLLVGREDTETVWPLEYAPMIVKTHLLNFGKESYVDGDNHLRRFMGVLAHCVHDHDMGCYSNFCFIEYDCLIFKRLDWARAASGNDTMVTTIAGGSSSGFHASRFFHCPWWMDRLSAVRILEWGKRMLNAGLIEQGFLDRWLGLMSDLYPLRITPAAFYSRNTLDTSEHIAGAAKAVAGGAWGVHGVKTEYQLNALLAELRDMPALGSVLQGQEHAA